VKAQGHMSDDLVTFPLPTSGLPCLLASPLLLRVTRLRPATVPAVWLAFATTPPTSCARGFEPKPIAGKPRTGHRRPKATGSPGIRWAKSLVLRSNQMIQALYAWTNRKAASSRSAVNHLFASKRHGDDLVSAGTTGGTYVQK
jgi:hypothetical protein